MNTYGKHLIVLEILSKKHILEQATAFVEYVSVKVRFSRVFLRISGKLLF